MSVKKISLLEIKDMIVEAITIQKAMERFDQKPFLKAAEEFNKYNVDMDDMEIPQSLIDEIASHRNLHPQFIYNTVRNHVEKVINNAVGTIGSESADLDKEIYDNLFLDQSAENFGFFKQKYKEYLSIPSLYKKFTTDSVKKKLMSLVPIDLNEGDKAVSLMWIVSTFIKDLEINKSISESLKAFFQIKQAKVDKILPKKNLLEFESFDEFISVVEFVKNKWEQIQYDIEEKKTDTQKDKIFENENWNVYAPETKQGACKLGSRTRWCTATTSANNMFNDYYSKETPLIIFISKQDPAEKYQFYKNEKRSIEFRDKENKEIFGKIEFDLYSLFEKIESIPDDYKDYAESKIKQIRTYFRPNYDGTGTYTYDYKGTKRLYYEDGSYRDLHTGYTYDAQGNLHSIDDKPSQRYEFGDYELEMVWHLHGKVHRDGGMPAAIYKKNDNGKKIVEERYYINDILYKENRYEDGEKIFENDLEKIEYFEDGGFRIGVQSFNKNLQPHSYGDAPAYDDEIKKLWYKNGRLHREGDKPAVITSDGKKEYWKNGNLYKKEDSNAQRWYDEDGNPHRDNMLPAVIQGDDKLFYFHGIYYGKIEGKKQEWVDSNREQHSYNDLPQINVYGDRLWFKHGFLHRGGDKPAIIRADGTQVWYKNHKIHRDGDKPAYIEYDDNGQTVRLQIWYRMGKKHRDGDRPAHIDGVTQIWYKNGKKHRDGDRPAVIDTADEGEMWYKNGVLHRDGDKPAVIDTSGSQKWYKDGKRYRSGGKPAIVFSDGTEMFLDSNERLIKVKKPNGEIEDHSSSKNENMSRDIKQISTTQIKEMIREHIRHTINEAINMKTVMERFEQKPFTKAVEQFKEYNFYSTEDLRVPKSYEDAIYVRFKKDEDFVENISKILKSTTSKILSQIQDLGKDVFAKLKEEVLIPFAEVVKESPNYNEIKEDLEKAILACYTPYTPELAKKELMSLVPVDLNEGDKAVSLMWIVSTFIKELSIDEQVQEHLKIFFQIKQAKMDKILPKKSLLEFDGFSEFTNSMQLVEKTWSEYQQSLFKDEDINKIYETEKWNVYSPKSQDASCKLGRDTKWCTAANSDLNMFHRYYSEDTPLVIFVSKQNSTEKYQFHLSKDGTREFKDKTDAEIHGQIEFELLEVLEQIDSIPPEYKLEAQKCIQNEKQYYTFYEDGTSLYEKGSTKLLYYKNGNYKHLGSGKTYDSRGNFHSIDDEPASIKKRSGETQKEWYKNGELHREGDKPAVVTEIFIEDESDLFIHNLSEELVGDSKDALEVGNNVVEDYYLVDRFYKKVIYSNGKETYRKQNEDVEFFEDGGVRVGKYSFDANLQPHSYNDKPCVQFTGENKQIQIQWKKHGVNHRDGDKPASITYDNSGNIVHEKFFKNGLMYKEKKLDKEYWYDNKERLHREYMVPAVIDLNYNDFTRQTGQKLERFYNHGFEYGMRITKGSSIMRQVWESRRGYHSYNDLPCIFYKDGDQKWYKDGKLHRDGDKPAIITAYGDQAWYKNGKEHREGDKPAVVEKDGSKVWLRNGKYYRANGKPTKELDDGTKIWQTPDGYVISEQKPDQENSTDPKPKTNEPVSEKIRKISVSDLKKMIKEQVRRRGNK
jgi:hypothetical protein